MIEDENTHTIGIMLESTTGEPITKEQISLLWDSINELCITLNIDLEVKTCGDWDRHTKMVIGIDNLLKKYKDF